MTGDPEPASIQPNESNNLMSMFATNAPSKENNNNLNQQDQLAALPPPPPKKKSQSKKKSKRDPSISGVFNLFGNEDEQIPSPAAPKMVEQRKEQTIITLNDLSQQKRDFAEQADHLEQKIELEENRTTDLESMIERIQREIQELRESKIQLIRSTEMEMRNMRTLMSDPDSFLR